MGKVMGEEDSRLFPLPIVHRALNIFTSVFIGIPCAQEPKRRPIWTPYDIATSNKAHILGMASALRMPYRNDGKREKVGLDKFCS